MRGKEGVWEGGRVGGGRGRDLFLKVLNLQITMTEFQVKGSPSHS